MKYLGASRAAAAKFERFALRCQHLQTGGGISRYVAVVQQTDDRHPRVGSVKVWVVIWSNLAVDVADTTRHQLFMGYRQNIIVSGTLERVTREHALQSARSRWPFLRGPRRSDEYSDRLLLALPELTDSLFDTEADYERALEQTSQIESALCGWSQVFPAGVFAYIEAECFGGACGYSGFAFRAGAILERADPSDHAHVRLLRHVDIVTDGFFEPFTRTYFEGQCSGMRA